MIKKRNATKRIEASELLEYNVKRHVSYRNTHGYRSLAELAKAIGISAPTLTHALKGNPSLSTIQKIADALNAPVSQLFKQKVKVEGYAIIRGNDRVLFSSVEELEGIIAEAKKTNIVW